MVEARILIVEDDGIIGRHIQNILTRLGYRVLGVAASGQEAIELTNQQLPDLILMDISLQGDMDGVDVADFIRRRFDIPIVYLTAYNDEATLRRAKISDPFGYILKPFDERTLHATIVMALHKHELELLLKENEERLRSLVENQAEGLVIVDPNETFSFANPAAVEIFGNPEGGLIGRTLAEFTSPQQFERIMEQTRLRSRGEKNSYEIEILRNDQQWRQIVVVAAPWFDKEGRFIGTCAVLRDVTEQKKAELAEREQRVLAEALRDTAAALTSTLNLDEVLERILNNVGLVVPHDAASVTLIEDGIGRVVRIQSASFSVQPQAPFRLSERVVLQRVTEGEVPLVLEDVRSEAGWKQGPGDWVRSYLGTPIRYQGRLMGVLNLYSAEVGFFSALHAERMRAFANQVAIALENAQLYDEEQERSRYLGLLNDLTQTAITAGGLQEMMEKMVAQIGVLFHVDGVYLLLWDEEQQLATHGAAYGLESELYPMPTALREEQVLTAIALSQMRPLVVPDTHQSPFLTGVQESNWKLGAVLVLPLVADGKNLGAILIGNQSQRVFKPKEVVRGEQVARQVALAIVKGRLFEEERQRAQQLARANSLITALSRVAMRFESALTPQQVIETLVSELASIHVSCILSLNQQPKLRVSSFDFEKLSSRPGMEELTLDLVVDGFRKQPIYQKLVSQRHADYIPHALDLLNNLKLEGLSKQQIARFIESVAITPHTRAVFLPLVVGEQETGHLWLWGEELGEDDLRALSVFASQVAIAVENARLYSEVEQLAMTDELTGLYNRRCLFQMANEQIALARQNERPFSLIIIDLDEFKAINDTYGHIIGDEVVCGVAERCRLNARRGDSLGRYGGDEFIMLLPGSPLEAAVNVAERIRSLILMRPIETSIGHIAVTASLGVASLVDTDTDLVSLLIRADKSLYAAKQAGRNQVMVSNL